MSLKNFSKSTWQVIRIMKKRRILHIQLLPILSGVQNAMLYLLQHLSNKKYDISVLSAPDGPLVNRVESLGFRHIALPNFERLINFKDLLVLIRLYKVCRKYKFHLVHTHSSKPGLLGRIAAKLAGVPIVVHTVQGFPFHTSQPKIHQYFYLILEKLGSYFCDMAVSVNKFERDLAIEKKILPAEKIITIYNGIEQPQANRKISKASLGFDDDDVVVGEIARFSKAKNIIKLIRISSEIAKNFDNIKFVYVGDGELWQKAKSVVKKQGVEDKIILPGWDTDIGAWNELFDISVSFSLWEGLSLSILEAMACAKPIVASDIKGNNEMVINGENGFLIADHSKRDFIDKITKLAKNENLRKFMGEKSLKIFEKKFTAERHVRKFNLLYNGLFNKKL
ncbi:MAG: glycosyltransferase family 4 protein [Candidatus Cloacimonetes bacterium]|nr:glycosyltransferase family 4 protein [Candidatus Cloacimonadota bacterium]